MTTPSQNLFVYLDCDWTEGPVLLGTLFCEHIRGASRCDFEFNRDWLINHPNLRFSEKLASTMARQHLLGGKEDFGFLSDVLPDFWGKLLLTRNEELQALMRNRKPLALRAVDRIERISDFTRIGALRFKSSPDRPFLNESSSLAVPPLSSLRELAHAAAEIEKSEIKNTLPKEKWLLQLLEPGSSLGGARPKASVLDTEGNLWIAKFPSVNDTYDVGGWEEFTYRMARVAGIKVADSKLLELDGKHHIFLVKRFDRKGKKRIHFASSMTLLGLKDGDGASTGHGYLDIVDAILENSASVEESLEELFRRVAFNIAIGNTDDHFRNHGFLLTAKGWTLSPAYDMNPTLNTHQSLLVNGQTDASDLGILRESAKDYMLPQRKADEIIRDVLKAMKNWEATALRLKLPGRDIEMFSSRFISTSV